MSQSFIARAQEDDGEDGEAARERERVGADEAVLDAAELTEPRPEAARDLADRAGDQRPLDEARRAPRAIQTAGR